MAPLRKKASAYKYTGFRPDRPAGYKYWPDVAPTEGPSRYPGTYRSKSKYLYQPWGYVKSRATHYNTHILNSPTEKWRSMYRRMPDIFKKPYERLGEQTTVKAIPRTLSRLWRTKKNNKAATTIQSAWRKRKGLPAAAPSLEPAKKRIKAASTISRAWRKRQNDKTVEVLAGLGNQVINPYKRRIRASAAARNYPGRARGFVVTDGSTPFGRYVGPTYHTEYAAGAPWGQRRVYAPGHAPQVTPSTFDATVHRWESSNNPYLHAKAKARRGNISRGFKKSH